MKTILLICCLIPSISFCQDFPKNENGIIEFSQVVTVDSVDAITLFSRSKIFVANMYKSAKDVTQLEDEIAKQMVLKGNFPLFVKVPFNPNQACGRVRFQTTIQCKDGRYRYIINAIEHDYEVMGKQRGGDISKTEKPNGAFTKDMWMQVRTKSFDQFQSYISLLEKFMSGKNSASSDNW